MKCFEIWEKYRKDSLQTEFRWVWETEHGEVSDHSGSDRIAATTWWSTGSTDGHILYLLPEKPVSVIESSEILILSKQLYRRLRSIPI